MSFSGDVIGEASSTVVKTINGADISETADASTVVKRDSSGDIHANHFVGLLSGILSGDVIGPASSNAVATVGGSTAAAVHTTVVNNTGISSGSNTGDQTITLTSDVTGSGTGSFATTVASVGGSTASNVHAAELLANAATNLNTASAIVKRDASGNFAAGTITAALSGNASTSTTCPSGTSTGTNTGDVTLGTANGLSLASQALSLQAADASHTGALSSTDWSTFNGKQASGNYITALTGAVTASGPGSVAATVVSVPASALPNPSATTLGGVKSLASVSHNFLTQIGTDGSVSQAQPAFSDISGSVAASQLPNPGASTLGGVESYAAVSNQWINTISTSGVPSSTQPAFSNISGSVAATQLPNPSASTLGGVQSAAAVSHQWINSISTSGVPALSQPASADISDATSANTSSVLMKRGSSGEYSAGAATLTSIGVNAANTGAPVYSQLNDNTLHGMWLDGHSGASGNAPTNGITFRTARDTVANVGASGAAVQSGDQLMFVSVRGNGGAGYVSGSRGAISINAAQTWTSTANGTKILFNTVANGTTTSTTNMTLGQDGSLTVVGAIAGSNLSGTNTGDATIASFGSSPTANALSISGQVITAQPADGTHPGDISLSAQTMGDGIKTFTCNPIGPRVLFQPTNGGTVQIDIATCKYADIRANAGVASYTILSPLFNGATSGMGANQELWILIYNNSGGPSTVTWDTTGSGATLGFAAVGGSFPASPANTKVRTIIFKYFGTTGKFTEVVRCGGDI